MVSKDETYPLSLPPPLKIDFFSQEMVYSNVYFLVHAARNSIDSISRSVIILNKL